MKTILVGVAVSNVSGEPDFQFFKIQCTNDQYDNGDHYDFAKEQAEANGSEAHLAFDQHDPAWYLVDADVVAKIMSQTPLSMLPAARDAHPAA